MADYKRPRRYYLHKRRHAEASGDGQLASVWRAKQAAESGTALPATMTGYATLAAAYYTTQEDLDGADATELQDLGLTQREAAAVLAELAELL